MLTTFRLDQTLKNRISALPLLSTKAKSFSHALRYLVDLGLTTFDQSLNVVNQDMETNIRFIAQKHDLGDSLSNQEISFILARAGSALSGRSFVHDETMQMLADTFASFIKSRCYAANDQTIHHVFKKFNLFNLVEGTFEDKKGDNSFVSLLSQDFYQSMEEGAETFKANLEAHSSPSNDESLIEPLKAFVNCLISFSQEKEGHLLSPVAFREALAPYMTALIQIAKCDFYRESMEDGTPPFHTSSQNLFVHQQGLEKPFHFSSQHILCHIWAHNLTDINATFVFEKKGVTLSLGFTAFDDLLEMARSTDRFLSFKEQGKETRGSLKFGTSDLSFLWSSDVQGKITSLLQTKSSSFMLDLEETRELMDLLLKISKELSEPLKALRYQLGSI